MELVVPEME